ncbi:MAG TPA: hypothetical protein VFJ01_04330, partial [Oleiagrimonas sp.]|nr:hypothetical protein [Oleiagrimonas sp.]
IEHVPGAHLVVDHVVACLFDVRCHALCPRSMERPKSIEVGDGRGNGKGGKSPMKVDGWTDGDEVPEVIAPS